MLPKSIWAPVARTWSATASVKYPAAVGVDVLRFVATFQEGVMALPRLMPLKNRSIEAIAAALARKALAQAHKAVEGDIAGVTRSLGVAFNSTFIALLISIVLMFLLHQLQLQQERLVLDTETYLDQHLIQHLQVP